MCQESSAGFHHTNETHLDTYSRHKIVFGKLGYAMQVMRRKLEIKWMETENEWKKKEKKL